MHLRRIALAAACSTAVIAPPAGAAIVAETYSVPTVGGARISVEVQRDDKFDGAKQPIILTYSPYNTLGENVGGSVADDGIASSYNPKGYARAVADVIGTRNSTGCWDYGGPREQQSGVDLVNFLAKLPWSNGKVGMIGGSYDGTTANMVAVRGKDVPGLAAIVPQAAINHWYGYAFQDGVRYLGNSEVPSDEGADTPLGFDYGLARTPPTKPDQASIVDLPTGRYNPCESVEHTQYGYDTTPDYNGFWRDRDYRKDADKVRVPILVTHGWQDYNVKQSEGLDMFESAVNSPLRMLYMWQGPHGTPGGSYGALVSKFWDYTLKGIDNGLDEGPLVYSQTRTGTTAGKVEPELAWPPRGTHQSVLQLGRGDAGGILAPLAGGEDASFTDLGNTSEEAILETGLTDERSWLTYQSEPLSAPVRIAGSPVLDALITDSSDHGQLSPSLLDIAPDGSATVISRGHLNLLYRNSLEFARPVTPGAPTRARVRFAPQDQTIPAGHRIGLIVAGSNVVWAVPDLPAGNTYDVRNGTSRLLLPIVG
jgi:X-Pro dipeptidyl-peptidase